MIKELWKLLNTPIYFGKWHQRSYRSFGGGGGSGPCNCIKGENHG